VPQKQLSFSFLETNTGDVGDLIISTGSTGSTLLGSE